MNQKRNYGIDLLRIIATFMIITLHVLGASGVLYSPDTSASVYVTAWLLELISYCAVNCYAIISGYVGVYSKFRASSIMVLWLQVFFWAVIITGAFVISGQSVSIVEILKSCIPVSSGFYWYFTAYFCTFFLSPFLDRLVLSLDKKMAGYLLIVFFTLFSVLPTLVGRDPFFLNYGYSAAWLIILYLVGGIIRVHYTELSVKKAVLFSGYMSAVLLTLLSKLAIEYLQTKIPISFLESNFLINYNSPTMVIAGVCLVLLFINLNIEKFKTIIAYFAPLTFGIYIIHTHSLLYERVLTLVFAGLLELNVILFTVTALGAVIGVFIGCAVLEAVRIKLFKCVNVSGTCRKAEGKIIKHFGAKE